MSYLKCTSTPEDIKSHYVTIPTVHHYDASIHKNITNDYTFFPFEKDIAYSPQGHVLLKLHTVVPSENDALVQIMNADEKPEQHHVNLEDIVENPADADR